MQARGVTALICNAIEALWTPSTPPANYNGDTPFTGTVSGHPDFTTPRESYWAAVDWFLDACRDRGIVVWLTPAYWGFAGASPSEGFGENGDLAANGTTRLTTYGAALGTRYRSRSNIVWVHFADALPDATGRNLVKAIQDGIKSTDRAGRLHTNHYARPSLSTDDTTVPCDINWAYAKGGPAGAPYVHQKVLDGYAVSGPVPVFLGEDYYDNRSGGALTAQQQRSQTWEAWLSGACGKFFGDTYTWSFNSPNAGASSELWQNHLADTGILQFGHARALLASRAWHLLAPSTGTGLVTSGGGTVNTSGYKPRALSSDGKLGLVYVTDGSSTTIDKSKLSGSFTARWYDPTNGSFTAIGTGIANSGTQAYSTPGNNAAGGTDWVWIGEVP